ncbi:MAG: hypothetical protein E7496_01645 [Ruminococcus sp.]|nr:hypothetical protein [Ruminococcus sp.]
MNTTRKIHDVPGFFSKLFSTKPFSIVFSVMSAILIWFAVSVTAYKTTHVTFYNIPVSYDISGTLAEANGLSAVSCNVEKINVEIEGNRSQIGRLTQEDLTAYLQIGNISTTGEFNFEIAVRSDTNIAFNTNKITPSYATVKLDKIETRTFDVSASFPNIKVTSGHVLNKDDVTCDPPVIEITGPSAQLAEIARVDVFSDKAVEIDSLYSLYTNEVRLYTEEGALMDTDHLEIPSTDFQINIPVLTQKELTLTYDIRNAFNGFDLNWLRERLHLSEESITLASQTNTDFTDWDNYNIGFVTLDAVSLEFSKEFNIDLKEEFINQSGFQQVTLALDSDGLASREVWVTSDNISVINVPKGYDCQLITRKMPINIIGDAEELETLSTQDIMVTVDLMNYNVQQNLTGSPDASISISPKNDDTSDDALVRMWAVGTYRVSVNLTEQAVETVPETDSSIMETE